jgi:hypothetical protein
MDCVADVEHYICKKGTAQQECSRVIRLNMVDMKAVDLLLRTPTRSVRSGIVAGNDAKSDMVERVVKGSRCSGPTGKTGSLEGVRIAEFTARQNRQREGL